MKKVIGIIAVVIVLAFGFLYRTAIVTATNNVLYQSPCAQPRTYSIGTIDDRFRITKASFLQATKEAGSLWKNADGQNLFVYDPASKLTISLVYDERQYLNNQVNDLNSQVENQKNSLKPEIADYETRAAAFKKRNAALNDRIDYWNKQGGAPEDEYKKLVDEQQSLQVEANKLQTMAQSLNQSTDQYNTQVQQLDKRVDAYNQTLQQKPEEGEYIRNGRDEKIVLYFNNSRPELIHTLAHKMGHAIGLSHNNNPFSIMYPKTTLNVELTADDISALAEVCRKRSLVETAREKFTLLGEAVDGVVTQVMSQIQKK